MPRRLRPAALIGAALAALLVLPATAAHAQQQTAYVALGDSYTSGTGIGDYYDQECLRSDSAYPRLLADDLGADLDFAACSGATTADVLADQLGGLDAGTDLVSITVGGNDIGWADTIVSCVWPIYDCTGDVQDTVDYAHANLPGLLDGVYSAITDRAPNADVYVLGYPRLFNEQRTCNALTQFSVAEQVAMNAAADELAGIIETAATAHGFTYVDVRDAFEGHAVCDDVEYVQGLVYPIVESFHPTLAGHTDGYYPQLAAAV